MIKYILVYLLIVNLIGCVTMFTDKKRAQKRQWRIREDTLFFIAIVGGSPGILAGMYAFRHKTKHLSFKLGIPAIMVLQIAAAIAIYKIYFDI